MKSLYILFYVSILLIIMKLDRSDFLMKRFYHATPAFILSVFTDQKRVHMASVNFWRN